MVTCADASSKGSTIRYERRRPERSALHRIVRENLPFLLKESEDPESGESGLPVFVKKELEEYVGCRP